MVPSFEAFCRMSSQGNLIPVYCEILADMETPVSAFSKLRGAGHQGSYLLESVEGGEQWGRYSFMGVSSAVVVTGFPDRVSIARPNQTLQQIHRPENPLLVLKDLIADYQPVALEGLPRFSGGAVGYVAYDLVRFLGPNTFETREGLKPSDILFNFMITDTLLIFDNVTHRIKIVAHAIIHDDRLQDAYSLAISKIEAIMKTLRSPMAYDSVETASYPSVSPLPHSNLTREAFTDAVLQAKSYIAAGDIFQVQLSQCFSVPFSGDAFTVYRALRSINPSPYLYYLCLGDQTLVGSSPEILTRLEDGIATLRPIAGTRRRGSNPVEDNALEKELLADPKERAEHLMLVDLGRNDLGRVCDYGTIVVDELMKIERYSHVMHIVSNVTGRLRVGADAFDLFCAGFPAGTVTGAPKIRAMEIIDALEPQRRGLYAGAVGYFAFQGNMEMCITIRTIIIENGWARIQAAAGIVADSDPNLEYDETVNKAKAMLLAIEMAQQGLR